MRALRLLALAAALVVPAAAAHAQYGVYAGSTPGYAVGWVPAHWVYNGYGRVWVPAHRVDRFDRGFYGYGHRWDRDRGWRHDRRW